MSLPGVQGGASPGGAIVPVMTVLSHGSLPLLRNWVAACSGLTIGREIAVRRRPPAPKRGAYWHRILRFNHGATINWHTARMPEEYDLTLLHPDGKLGRDIAIMRTEIEELHAKLARMPAVIARAALGIIFSTAIITTLLGWWFLV